MYHLSHEPVPYIDILKVFIREICLKIMSYILKREISKSNSIIIEILVT
jgi:hypothetical protein